MYSLLSLAYDFRKRLFRYATTDRSKRKNSSSTSSSFQQRKEHQSLVDCFQSIRLSGKESLTNLTLFFERLVSENEKESIPYGLLLEIYNQRIQNASDHGSHYLDYDTVQSVMSLWKRIRKNGNCGFPLLV